MAEIREDLILADNFSDAWNRYIELGAQAADQTLNTQQSVNEFAGNTADSFSDMDAAFARFAASGREANTVASELESSASGLTESLDSDALSGAGLDELQEGFTAIDEALETITEGIEEFATITDESIQSAGESLAEYNEKQAEVNDLTQELTNSTENLSTAMRNIAVEEFQWNYNNQAEEAIANNEALENGAENVAQSMNLVEMATELAKIQAAELAEEQARVTEELENYSASLLENVDALTEQASAITYVEPSVENYEKQISAVERAIGHQNDKLTEAATKLQDTIANYGAASAEADKQRQAVASLSAALTDNIAKYDELNDQLEEFVENNPEEPFEETNRAADKAANGGVSNLINKLTRLAGAYISLKGIALGVASAIAEEQYEIRFGATFGQENAQNALAWVRETANELGRTTQQIADATTQFSRSTTNPANIEALTNLADRFTRFSVGGDYNQLVSGISNALRTGNIRQLSTETGISTQALKDFGVEDALGAGDVDAFVRSLEAAAETIGITEEAYQAALNSSGAQLDKFTNTVRNKAQQAARGFLDAFGPAFQQLNEFLNSEQGATLFAGLQSGFSAAGLAASYLVDILFMVANFLASNWSTVVTAASIGLGLFAFYMAGVAIATLATNIPLLLFIGLIVAVAAALVQMGAGAEEVFTVVGGGFGFLYNLISNILGNLWNAIASFVEFFANVWDDPLGSVARLFADVFDSILGIVETVAQAIDFVLGTSLSSGVSNFRNEVKGWVSSNFENSGLILDRWETTSLQDDITKFSDAGAKLGQKLDNLDIEGFLPGAGGVGGLGDSLGGFAGQDLIGADGAVPVKVKGDVSLANEDLKYIIDLAERRYVADVNVRTLAPNLEVNVTNQTKGEPMTPADIADVVMYTLEEQVANHSDLTYDY